MVGRQLLCLFLIAALCLSLRSVAGQDTVTSTCTNQTVRQFWHESSDPTCGVDVRSAFQVYGKISGSKTNIDQFDALIKDEIAKSLNEILVSEIVVAIQRGLLTKAKHLSIFDSELYKIDYNLIQMIWKNVLEKLHDHQTQPALIVEQVMMALTNTKLKFDIIQYFWSHYDLKYRHYGNFLPSFTYALTTLLNNDLGQLDTHQAIAAEQILNELPQQLLDIYQSQKVNVTILNRGLQEYMLADQDRGPTAEKRLVFTYIRAANSPKIKGKFKLQFNARGMVSIAVHFLGAPRCLKADEDNVSFCPNCMDSCSTAQWWNVVWPFGRRSRGEDVDDPYVYLQHSANGNLLCATRPYDANRRWLQVMAVRDRMSMESCQWKISQRHR